jgi:CBS domain containing-hemolysin-like protein
VRAASIGAWANDLLPSDTLPAEEEDGSEAEEAEEERRLITSVIEFSDTIVREVMVPRTAMVTIKAVDSVDRLLALIEEHGFSRFPVAGPGEDIVGMVIAKDLLPAVARDKRPATVSEIMRPIDFVPETKRASDLLKEMQAKKIHMAVAIDEFGDVAGLVTLEDLLEELVGEIVDEYDEEEPMVRPVGEGVWLVDGRAGIDELSVAVNIDLPDEDWDTVAGLVLGLAGRFPEVDENLELGDLRFKVLRLQGRRVADVEVQRVATVDAAVEDRR